MIVGRVEGGVNPGLQRALMVAIAGSGGNY